MTTSDNGTNNNTPTNDSYRQHARILELTACLVEARSNMEDWAAYASDYFRQKHNLAADLAAIDEVLGNHNE